MGGAIRVITAQPDPKQFSANSEAGFSDIDRGGVGYSAKGAINLPLSDTLAIRLVATHSEDGGWIDRSMTTDFTDITPGEPITRRNENIVDRSSFRATIRWAPDNTWTITPSFIYQNIGTQGFPEYYPDAGIFVRPHVYTDQGSFNAAISSIRVEKDLGPLSLTSSTAYIDKHTLQNYDWAEFGQLFAGFAGLGTIVPTIPYVLPVGYHEFTEELRATSRSSGMWRWIAGVYFNDTTQVNTEYATSNAFLPAGTSDVYFYDAPVHDRQVAGFGEITLVPNEHLDVTAGVRVYQFHTVEQITQGGLEAGPDLPQTRGSNSGVNPKLTATYKLDPSISLYATAAKGFREGGVNSALTAGTACTFESTYKLLYGADTVWNYEVGAKTTFLDGRGSFNASAFQLEWNNFQGSVVSNCGDFTANIGKARTRGVELEGSFNLNRYVSAHMSFSYDDAAIQSLAPGLQTAGVGMPGDQLINVPKVQASFGANFDMPIVNGWAWFVRPNWQYVGTAPSSYTDQSAAATRPAYSNVDFTTGFRKAGWELSGYVHNLTNSLQVNSIGAPLLDGYQYLTNPPRTYGVMFRYKY
jgi:outer membrane receptor protein involved in Fe transport